jgi:hypothetical protein
MGAIIGKEGGNAGTGINYPASGVAILQLFVSKPSSVPQAELNAALAVVVLYLIQAAVVLPYSTES